MQKLLKYADIYGKHKPFWLATRPGGPIVSAGDSSKNQGSNCRMQREATKMTPVG